MRDRIVLTMEQQKEIDARVNVAYPEFGSVYQKNLPLLHFDFVSVVNIEDHFGFDATQICPYYADDGYIYLFLEDFFQNLKFLFKNFINKKSPD